MAIRFGRRRLTGLVVVVLAVAVAAPANGLATADPDTEVPLLTGVSLSTSTASPGTLVKLNITATDAQPQVYAKALLTNRDVQSWEQPSVLALPFNYGGDPLSLPIEVTDAHRNGRWELTEIYLVDSLGNSATYYLDGTVSLQQGSTGPSANLVSFAEKTLTISGAASPQPQLKSLSLPTTLVRGKTVDLTFAAPPGPAPTTITLEASGPHVSAVGTFQARVTSPTTAALTVPANAQSWDGYHVERVKVTDATGRWTLYTSVGYRECSGVCVGNEPFAFPTAMFDVVGLPDKVDAVQGYAGDHSGYVNVWPAADNGRRISTYHVVVNPGAKVISVPATGVGGQRIPLSGLQNNVRYTVDVSAVNAVGMGPASRAEVIPRMPERLTSPHDVTGDAKSDIVGAAGNNAYLWRGTGLGTVKPATIIGQGWDGFRTFLPAGAPQIGGAGGLWAFRYDGSLRIYTWSPSGAVTGFVAHSGFERYRLLISPGDVTGDNRNDILGVTDSGAMELVAANINGPLFRAPVHQGFGWGGFRQLFGVGDLNGDRKNDIVGVLSDGTLWLYYGNGKGGFSSRRQIGSGWQNFRTVFAAADLTGDRKLDIVAVNAAGAMYVYRGNGKGGLAAPTVVTTGWQNVK